MALCVSELSNCCQKPGLMHACLQLPLTEQRAVRVLLPQAAPRENSASLHSAFGSLRPQLIINNMSLSPEELAEKVQQ